ncbi:hypothetical protein B0T26DRAFT_677990 [Lasiosphaeria miniovina]|uniref:Uncharacterized protein n=1 Tax=Lasiosphaeria miniovina TaxID=1954250 RepID=A0AA40AD92_9PEZI|nr:uncharacterized protein B0T26DRAFT_677990 [Lasiosphaeria miniovina]KAK0713685.1 hypothetical protein B0T26DRAFT_677990 [Lasiosphaeria miniovina]
MCEKTVETWPCGKSRESEPPGGTCSVAVGKGQRWCTVKDKRRTGKCQWSDYIDLLGVLNATCFREYILKYLQEPMEDPELEYKRPAQALMPPGRTWFEVISEMWMDERLQAAIARLYMSRGKKELLFTNWEGLVAKVPALNNWEHQDEEGEQLVLFLLDSTDKIHEIWAAKKKKADIRTASRASEASISPDASRKRAVEASVDSPTASRSRA